MNTQSMITNYIYLLQEREFTKTTENIYKVGRTKKENHQRFNQYPKGSILLFQMICNNCENIEGQIIKIFKEKFNQRKDIGNEYFEGDYRIMIDIIYSTIKNENFETNEDFETNDTDIIFKDSDYIYDEYEIDNDIQRKKWAFLEKKIQIEFPDYKLFKHKTYFKIKNNNNKYVIVYVNPRLGSRYSDRINTFGECIVQHTIDNNVADKLEYFNSLLKSNILIIDKIYDLDSEEFINKINKTKIKINFDEYDDYINLRDFHYYNLEDGDAFEKKIKDVFYCNLIINDELYCTSVKEYEKHNSMKNILKLMKDNNSFDNFSVDIGIQDYIIVTIYKINTKFYDYKSCLRKYIPYLIRWDSNYNYYLLNRDYEYIGTSLKHIEHEITNQIYLFNDGNKPWESKEDYINMCIKYHKIIKENGLLNCKTINKTTKKLLSLFD